MPPRYLKTNSTKVARTHIFLSLLLVVGILAWPGCSRTKQGDNYTSVSADDQAMNEAIAKAKATSGDFVKALHEQREGTTDFYVKKPYPTPDGGEEHMWIEVSGETNGVITGIISNDAEDTRVVKFGQQVSVKIDEISDWKYTDGRKLVGGYTVRVLLDRMPPKEREQLLKEGGFEL